MSQCPKDTKALQKPPKCSPGPVKGDKSSLEQTPSSRDGIAVSSPKTASDSRPNPDRLSIGKRKRSHDDTIDSPAVKKPSPNQVSSGTPAVNAEKKSVEESVTQARGHIEDLNDKRGDTIAAITTGGQTTHSSTTESHTNDQGDKLPTKRLMLDTQPHIEVHDKLNDRTLQLSRMDKDKKQTSTGYKKMGQIAIDTLRSAATRDRDVVVLSRKEFKAFQDKNESLETTIEPMQKMIVKLEKDYNPLKKSGATLGNELVDKQRSKDDKEKRINDQNDLIGAFDETVSKWKTSTERLEETQAELVTSSINMTDITMRLSSLTENFATNADTQHDELSACKEDVKNDKCAIQLLANDIENLKKQNELRAKGVTELETQNKLQADEAQKLREEHDTLKGDFETYKIKMNESEAQLTGQATTISKIQGDLTSELSRLQSLHDQTEKTVNDCLEVCEDNMQTVTSKFEERLKESSGKSSLSELEDKIDILFSSKYAKEVDHQNIRRLFKEHKKVLGEEKKALDNSPKTLRGDIQRLKNDQKQAVHQIIEEAVQKAFELFSKNFGRPALPIDGAPTQAQIEASAPNPQHRQTGRQAQYPTPVPSMRESQIRRFFGAPD